MESSRVLVEFIVSAELPNDESLMEAILSALPTTVEDIAVDANAVEADIVHVEEVS